MMTKFREFIEQRRALCEDEISALQARERELKIQLAECRSEIDNLYVEIGDLETASQAIGASDRGQRSRLTKPLDEIGTVTIKEAVLAVLTGAPSGLIALDILNRINQRFNLQIARTSLSPQLTRLKIAREITLRGSIWTRINHDAGTLDYGNGENEIGPEGDASGPKPGGSRPLTPASE